LPSTGKQAWPLPESAEQAADAAARLENPSTWRRVIFPTGT
jgi:hypothetical protein